MARSSSSGLVVLVGLAAKNAIVIVEFAQQGFREGKSALGQPFVVENRPRANGNIRGRARKPGWLHAAAASDGPIVINPSLYPSLPSDPCAT